MIYKFFRLFKERTKEDFLVADIAPERVDDKRTLYDIYTTDEVAYTEVINKHVIHKIVADLLSEVRDGAISEIGVQHEYFRIDTVGWITNYTSIDKEVARRVDLNRHLWNLEIAVEHENNKRDWPDEVIKLIHICCPVKVIIGYNYCDCRAEGDCSDKNKLMAVAEWMHATKAFSQRRDSNEQYLIILGNAAAKDKSKKMTYRTFDYRGYLYNYQTKRFEEL